MIIYFKTKTMKRKRNYLYVLLPILAVVMFYLVFSFGTWELNPSKWSDETRHVSAMLFMVSILAGIGISATINED